MTESKKIMDKFREAERLRHQREREEQESLLNKVEDLSTDNARLSKKASRAEREYYNLLNQCVVLPDDFTSMVVSKMVAKMVDSEIYRGQVDAIVAEVMRRMVIRIDKHRMPMGVEVDMRQGGVERDPVVTVTIPEMRLTQVLDDHYLQSITGGKGPYIMEDRQIGVMKDNSSVSSPAQPLHAISYESSVDLI